MPVYEYDCPSCGVHEVTQRITEPALGSCTTCGSPVRRLISATAFALKGGGWYATDYARKEESRSEAAPSKGCGAEACGTGGCGAAEA